MFELNKTQKEIQKAAKGFAKGEFDKDLAYEFAKACKFPEKIWKKASDLGFIGLHFTENYSGGGMGMLESAIAIEEFCRKDASIGSALALAGYAAECILRFGTKELKEKYLAPVAKGEMLSGGAFTETQRGAEYTKIETFAVKQGNELMINGTKTNVINGGTAGFYVVLCQTDIGAETSEKGKSMILVESNRPGLTVQKAGKKLGCNMTSTATLTFENVVVPDTNLIGKEGNGYSQLMTFLDESRILTAAQSLGTAQGSFDRALDYTKGRVQFNKKLAEFQVSRHKLAKMATKIELARLITYKAAWTRDKGKIDTKLAAMAKMTAGRTAMEVGAQTIQLFGGYGYMTEYEVERYYRDAKVMELHEGARDMQKDSIAQAVIGRIR